MCGCWWRRSAVRVAGGMTSRVTKRTGLPDLAAHAAAGIEYDGASALTTRTASLGAPRAEAARRSTSLATVNGSPPLTSVLLKPEGRATEPTRMTCAPFSDRRPRGPRPSSAAELAAGIELPLV